MRAVGGLAAGALIAIGLQVGRSAARQAAGVKAATAS